MLEANSTAVPGQGQGSGAVRFWGTWHGHSSQKVEHLPGCPWESPSPGLRQAPLCEMHLSVGCCDSMGDGTPLCVLSWGFVGLRVRGCGGCSVGCGTQSLCVSRGSGLLGCSWENPAHAAGCTDQSMAGRHMAQRVRPPPGHPHPKRTGWEPIHTGFPSLPAHMLLGESRGWLRNSGPTGTSWLRYRQPWLLHK